MLIITAKTTAMIIIMIKTIIIIVIMISIYKSSEIFKVDNKGTRATFVIVFLQSWKKYL